MNGASGGDIDYGISYGGYGATMTCIIPVTAGATYRLYVGGKGVVEGAGWNGGGTATLGYGCGGGGGASDIRASPYGLADRLVVAGGGGGSAQLGYKYQILNYQIYFLS